MNTIDKSNLTINLGNVVAVQRKNKQDRSRKNTAPNRSVYAIGFPHRENLLAKEDR